MKVVIDDSGLSLQLNEMFVKVEPSLPANIENSVFYPRLQHALRKEMISFFKEQIELRDDMLRLLPSIGEPLPEYKIREMFDTLTKKHNSKDNNNGVAYHIEVTRVDYGVPVFTIIKRGDTILVKKFVFRFRKKSISGGLDDVSSSGIPDSKK
jgi:hypothetical protein